MKISLEFFHSVSILNFYIEIFFTTIFIFYIKKLNIDCLFSINKSYVKLSLFSLMLMLPWVALTGIITKFILAALFNVSSLIHPQTSGKFVYYFENNGSMFFLLCIYSLIIAPAYEEILFRGFVQTYTSRLFGTMTGIIFTSLAFSAIHYHVGRGISNLNIMSCVFVSSIILGFLYSRTCSLFACILLHSVNNLLALIGSLIE